MDPRETLSDHPSDRWETARMAVNEEVADLVKIDLQPYTDDPADRRVLLKLEVVMPGMCNEIK